MKHIFILLSLLISASCFGQKQKKVSGYIDFHVNTTLYDRTISNNAGGFGGGLQVFMNTKTKFRPSIEIASDAFGGTKEMHLTSDGRPIYAKDFVTAILAGSSYDFFDRLYLNVAAGPSFFNSAAYLTIKPAIGVYFPRNHFFVFKTSFTHIFQHDDISNEGFGFLNFSLGIKIF